MNKNLSIFKNKDEIVRSVKANDITIITAETGTGKSTQVPQYLFEAGYDVICTQPRRIACVTLAERVAKELDSNVVGYRTAFESTENENTKILFCTDGLQIAKGLDEKALTNTILILDEVHEWNLNVETLVAWIKKKKSDSSRLKVVLMSATIDVDSLADYFRTVTSVGIVSAGNSNYNVRTNFDFEEDVEKRVVSEIRKGHNVLVFQPGKKEINDCIDRICKLKGDAVCDIFPLHGELDISDQRKIFSHYDVPKVIVSTNIAQTSITIDDIDTVVDTGTEKMIVVSNGIESLVNVDISRADILQRAGRAGRTHEGDYYLCSPISFDQRKDVRIPEIKRLPLDKVILKLYSVGLEVEDLDFFHKPDSKNIHESKKKLLFFSAIEKKNDAYFITEKGKRMSMIPTDVTTSNVLLKAEEIGCGKDILIACAVNEIGSLLANTKMTFNSETRRPRYSDIIKEKLDSDIIAEVRLYKKVQKKAFINLKSVGLSYKSFQRIREMVTKLTNLLSTGVIKLGNDNSDSKIIRAFISSAYDNIFARTYFYNDCYHKLGDPYSTFKITNSSIVAKDSPDFVIGKAIKINAKGRFIFDNTMNLIEFATKISVEDLIEIVGDDLEIKFDRVVCYEYIKGDKITIPCLCDVYYKGGLLTSSLVRVKPGDKLYEEARGNLDKKGK